MDNPLLKYSAKEYFFKASLCHFIVDELNAKASFSLSCSVLGLGKHGGGYSFLSNTPPDSPQIAIEKYEEMFPAFSDSRECKLLKVTGAAHSPTCLIASPFICSAPASNLHFFLFTETS